MKKRNVWSRLPLQPGVYMIVNKLQSSTQADAADHLLDLLLRPILQLSYMGWVYTHVFRQQWLWLVNKTYQNGAPVKKANCTNEFIFTECDRDQWKCKSGQCIPVAAYCNDYPDCLDNSDEENCPTIPPYITTTYSPYRPPRPPVTTQAPFYTTTSYPYRPPPPIDLGQGKIFFSKSSFSITKSWRNIKIWLSMGQAYFSNKIISYF